MSYQVLARRWRPKIFADVIGQQHIINAITNSFLLEKIHHSILLSGIRGVGKTTVARLFAKGLSCVKAITIVPCGECKNCCDIDHGCFVDLIEVDAATRTKVEDIHDLLSNVHYTPVCGQFKIYLIDEVHMLSRHSFNALLKVLEEPPEYVKFILLTTEKYKLPVTVLSRCFQLHLKALDCDQIFNYLIYILKKENIEFDSYVLQLLANAAHGSLRDALNLTDQAIVLGMNKITVDVVKQMFGLLNVEQPILMLEALVHADSQSLMKQIERCSTLGVDWEFLLIELLSLLRKLAVDQILPIQINDDDESLKKLQRLRKLRKYITPSDLQLLYKILLTGRQELPFAPNYRMGVEMTLLRALSFYPVTNNDLHDTSSSSTDEVNFNVLDNENVIHCNNDNEGIINNNLINDDIKESIFDKKSMSLNFLVPKYTSFSIVDDNILSEDTISLLQARAALAKRQSVKKNEQSSQYSLDDNYQKFTISILERFSDINKRVMTDIKQNTKEKFGSVLTKVDDLDACGLQIKSDVYDEKILINLMQEVVTQDSWAAQINKLFLSDLSRQVAMNSWKENLSSNKICLHLRSKYCHLSSEAVRNELQRSLSSSFNFIIELSIDINDDSSFRTPMEWCQYIYRKRSLKKKNIILPNTGIERIQKIFGAELEDTNGHFI